MAFAVHAVHVLAMAVLVGGLTAGALGSGSRRLEWVMWGAVGAIVATGVGNIGEHGGALPGRGTTWGALLLAKLALVVSFLAASLRRTLTIWAGQEGLGWYRATAGLAAVVALLGVWLAHG